VTQGRTLAAARSHAATALLVGPLLVFLAAAFYYPLGFTLAESVTDKAGAWTAANFVAFLGSAAGLSVLGLTLVLSVAATVLAVVLCLPLALALRRGFPGKAAVQFLMMVPITIPALVGALGLLILYDRTGWVNFVLVRVLHLTAQPLAIDYTIPGLVLFYVWMFFPYGGLVILSGLGAIDPSLEEAARVCGASAWVGFRRVLLPLLRPSLWAGGVMIFLQCFGAFSVPLIAGGNHQPIAVRIYTVANVFLDWHAASAMAVVMAVIQSVLVVAYQSLIQRRGAQVAS
jgi:ABC-type Fe3+ transport system permease subunit